MARVPRAQNLVELRPVTDAKFQAFDRGEGYAGRGMQALAGSLNDVAEFAARQQTILDEASAKHLFNDYVTFANGALHSGEDPFYQKAGQSALVARPDVEKALKDRRQMLLDATKTRQQRDILETVLTRRVEDDLAGIGTFALKQGRQFAFDEADARSKLSGNDAVQNAFNPEVSEAAIATGLAELDQVNGIKQLGPDASAAARLAYESSIRKDVAVRFVYEGDKGPDVAEAYLKKYGERLTGDDATAIETHIRTRRNGIAAEQRRDQAELQRAIREAKRDAADRAEGVMRILDTGTPLPDKDVASAIADARAAGRDDLVFRLGQGSFKNSLNVQWRNATPAEMQARVNELGAKIAKSGKNVDPKDQTEYDHLSTLLGQNRSALNADPLAWGASHLGENVPPVNWSDPNSVAQRVAVADRIAKRTGVQPQYLTQDEAAQWAPLVETGTVEQRRQLVDRLAGLGPRGAAAARQLAPNDDKFIGLIGLATLRQRTVSSRLVTDIIAGSEVLKGNPKLIDKDQALRAFQNHVGGAFQLLPSTANGVKANAEAMLGADSARHGYVDWGTASGRYAAMVNQSLGAYRDPSGVMRGGIGTWAGQRFILPEDWSQQDFDTRLARADADAIKRGSNGNPVWSNGKPLWTGDIKKMGFVAVGNGRYRLTDGSGFIRRKEGGFYEIDMLRVGAPVGR